MSRYYPLVDILRFVAALSVVIFHYFSFSLLSDDILDLYARYGYMGVQLFFIISGFVIYFSLSKSIKEYALSRFLRLYPLFWVLCSATYILTIIFDREHALSIKNFFFNLFIVNTGKTALMVDGSYWTLTMEIVFYFMIGVYVYLFKLKRIEWFYAGWLLITAAIFYFGLEGELVSKLLLARYAPYFIIGGLTGLIVSTHKTSTGLQNIRRLALLALAMLLPFYISGYLASSSYVSTNNFGIYDNHNNIILLIIYILFLLAVLINPLLKITKGNNKSLLIKISLALGSITYPLYLLHQKVGSIIIGGVSDFGFVSYYSVLTMIFIVGVSYIIAVYEEKWREISYNKLINKFNLNKI